MAAVQATPLSPPAASGSAVPHIAIYGSDSRAYSTQQPQDFYSQYHQHHQQAEYAVPSYGIADQQQPQYRPGTLPPGTAIVIGQHSVVVEKFLSEGGFAHVYLVHAAESILLLGEQTTRLVLKRVAVPDKETLREVRWEVDVMKAVRGHRHIVNLIEASASPSPGTQGYEVFILMEYCAGGGIIDMMNTRLQNRLTESEILKIFSDVVEAVCWMHTRDPPLMHRDLKVENILLAGSQFYKLCDFGSATTPKATPPSIMPDIQAFEAELNRHTTLQYRSPEMCDVWSRKAVGLPSDIWALGVLLYKLCFYITPFEEQGPLAILNVQYIMPSHPAYSNEIRKLIATMLVESGTDRPTAYAVHQEVCRLRGVQSKSHYDPRLHPSIPLTPSPAFGRVPIISQLPSRPASSLDEIAVSSSEQRSQSGPAGPWAKGAAPMRRGRPHKAFGESSPYSAGQTTLSTAVMVPDSVASSVSHGGGNLIDSGFDDSFRPAADAVMSMSPPATTLPTAYSKTALATAALFESLASPDAAVTSAPTLANLQAQSDKDRTDVVQKVAAVRHAHGSQSLSQHKLSARKPSGPRALSRPSSTLPLPQSDADPIISQALAGTAPYDNAMLRPSTEVRGISRTGPMPLIESTTLLSSYMGTHGRQISSSGPDTFTRPLKPDAGRKPELLRRASQTVPPSPSLHQVVRNNASTLHSASTTLPKGVEASPSTSQPDRQASNTMQLAFQRDVISTNGSAGPGQTADLLSDIENDVDELYGAKEVSGSIDEGPPMVVGARTTYPRYAFPTLARGYSKDRFRPAKPGSFEVVRLEAELPTIHDGWTPAQNNATHVTSEDGVNALVAIAGGKTEPYCESQDMARRNSSLGSDCALRRASPTSNDGSGKFDITPAPESTARFVPPQIAGRKIGSIAAAPPIIASKPSRDTGEISSIESSQPNKPKAPAKPPKPKFSAGNKVATISSRISIGQPEGLIKRRSSVVVGDHQVLADKGSSSPMPTSAGNLSNKRELFKPSRELSSSSISSLSSPSSGFTGVNSHGLHPHPVSMRMPTTLATPLRTSLGPAAKESGRSEGTANITAEGTFRSVPSLRDLWNKSISDQQQKQQSVSSGHNRRVSTLDTTGVR